MVFISGIHFRPGGFRKTKFNPVLKRHDQKIWLGDDPGDQSKLAPITAAVATAKDEDADCFEFSPELVGLHVQELDSEKGCYEEERPPRFYDSDEGDNDGDDDDDDDE